MEITQDVKEQVEIIFYVKEDTNSPYQGRLLYTADEHAKLSEKDIEAAQTAQFEAWKANNAVLQAEALAREEFANTIDGKLATLEEIQKQRIDLASQMDALVNQIDTIQADAAVQDKLTEIAIAAKADVEVKP